MINNNEEKENNSSIKLEEVELNPERNTFENKLRNTFSKEDVIHNFDIITELKLIGWENKLFESKLPIRDLSKVTDADILNEVSNDVKTIRVIKGDIERTRVQESIYMMSFKDYIYQIIIYYINKNNIAYKQGLNEIVGPFVLLKHKLQLSFSRIYKIIVCFIDKFLTNYYQEQEFYSLKSSFSLINLLLKYHDPEIFHRFEHCMITPDLYATSWLLTLFSGKCSLNILYYLWDRLILFDDNLFPHFFIIAFLIINKNKFNKNDNSILLSVIGHLEIETIEEINILLNYAAEIRDKTPSSFYLLSNKLDIFNFNSKHLKEYYEYYNPDKMLALPMFANDIFCITYRNIIGCLDENCENFRRNKNVNNLYKCIYCRNKQAKKNISYIIIDLRIFGLEEKNNKNNDIESKIFSNTFPGFLPRTLRIDNKDLENENFPKNILNEYKNEKDNYHFIIITSDTNDYEKFEKEFYKDKRRKSNKIGLTFKKEKELDKIKVDEKFKKKNNNKEYLLLIEYDYFKKLIEGMNQEGFKYVSYVYGGYKEIHAFAIKHNIDLLEHGKQCILCKEIKKGNNSSFFKFWK